MSVGIFRIFRLDGGLSSLGQQGSGRPQGLHAALCAEGSACDASLSLHSCIYEYAGMKAHELYFHSVHSFVGAGMTHFAPRSALVHVLLRRAARMVVGVRE